MKSIYVLLCFICFIQISLAQQAITISGVFQIKEGEEKSLWLFTDHYCSQIKYKDDAYISTFGGPYTYDGKSLTVHVEYNDGDPATVGTTETFQLTASSDGLQAEDGRQWSKQPTVKQELDGLWRITSRKQDDKMTTIERSDRKTIKILVDGYFQWIAINPAVKGFYGTGGGNYTFQNGKYNEQIIFFSRDNARVGANLSFDGSLQHSQWHHSGLSSKGDPIHEIWSREK